jgi:hypothetical protein
MKIRVTLEDGSERVYDVLSMEVVVDGAELKGEIRDGARGSRLVNANSVTIAFGKSGPYIRWDGTGDLALGTNLTNITIVD